MWRRFCSFLMYAKGKQPCLHSDSTQIDYLIWIWTHSHAHCLIANIWTKYIRYGYRWLNTKKMDYLSLIKRYLMYKCLNFNRYIYVYILFIYIFYLFRTHHKTKSLWSPMATTKLSSATTQLHHSLNLLIQYLAFPIFEQGELD